MPDRRVQIEAPDLPPSWALRWAQEIEDDTRDSVRSWAFKSADKMETQQNTLPSAEVQWDEAEQWAKELTEEWERTRSCSPLRRLQPATANKVGRDEPVDKASVLPSVDMLLNQAKTAQYLRSKASIAADECHSCEARHQNFAGY